MNDYYSKIFPQSTYRKSNEEAQKKQHREIKTELPSLKKSPANIKKEINEKVHDAVFTIAEALGIARLIKESDQTRVADQILNQMECK